MVDVFGQIFEEKENIENAFYREVDIATCGISLENQTFFSKPRNADTFLSAMKDVLHKNAFDRRYLGRPGTNAFFLDQKEKETVFGAWDDEETHGYFTCLTAREGILVKMDIRDDGTGLLMDFPVRYQLLEWKSIQWDDHGNKQRPHAFPYFQTHPLGEGDPRLEEILWDIRWFAEHVPQVVTEFTRLGDVPAQMRGFYLRKNKRAWWAANRIAAVWSRVYWDPETVVGRRRLARRFVE